MLEEYEYSLGLLLPDDPPLAALYAQHIHHTLYVILYGKLDLISMLDDYEWLASEHFVIAGDHAVKAAQVLLGFVLTYGRSRPKSWKSTPTFNYSSGCLELIISRRPFSSSCWHINSGRSRTSKL
jgi:hypothetical protein